MEEKLQGTGDSTGTKEDERDGKNTSPAALKDQEDSPWNTAVIQSSPQRQTQTNVSLLSCIPFLPLTGSLISSLLDPLSRFTV